MFINSERLMIAVQEHRLNNNHVSSLGIWLSLKPLQEICKKWKRILIDVIEKGFKNANEGIFIRIFAMPWKYM